MLRKHVKNSQWDQKIGMGFIFENLYETAGYVNEPGFSYTNQLQRNSDYN